MKKTIWISFGVFFVTLFSIVSFTLTADKVMAAFDTNIFVPLPGNSVLIMSQQASHTSGSVSIGRDFYNRDTKFATPLQICSTYTPVISGCVAYVKPTSCSAGNICTSSATYSLASGAVTTITIPPSAPTNLTVATTSATQARLTWTASTQGTYPVRGYKVFKYANHLYVQIGISPTNSLVTAVVPGTTYRYTVKAYDNTEAQNLSVQHAGPVTLVIPPTQVSSIKITAPVSGEVWASGSTHRISWTANVAPGTAPKFDIIQIPYPIPAGADVEDYQTGIGGWGRTGTYYDWQVSGMAGYSKYLLKMCISGTNVCDTTRVPFGVTFGSAVHTTTQGSGTTGTIPVSVTNTNTSSASGVVIPATAPSAPTNLRVATTSPTQALLSWTASMAGTNPIASYKIYNGNTLLGTSVTNSFTTTVAAGSTYSFVVIAIDNASTPNASTPATVSLIIPASVPASTSAVVRPLSGSGVYCSARVGATNTFNNTHTGYYTFSGQPTGGVAPYRYSLIIGDILTRSTLTYSVTVPGTSNQTVASSYAFSKSSLLVTSSNGQSVTVPCSVSVSEESSVNSQSASIWDAVWQAVREYSSNNTQ